MEEKSELTGEHYGEFSELWSEPCPCQSQGKLGDEFFEVHFHNWPR